jgi:hypothetical protein
MLKALHPGVLAIARQLQQDYDFSDIKLVLPTTLLTRDMYWISTARRSI